MSDKYDKLYQYFKYLDKESQRAMIITLELVNENILANNLKKEYNKLSERMKGDHPNG